MARFWHKESMKAGNIFWEPLWPFVSCSSFWNFQNLTAEQWCLPFANKYFPLWFLWRPINHSKFISDTDWYLQLIFSALSPVVDIEDGKEGTDETKERALKMNIWKVDWQDKSSPQGGHFFGFSYGLNPEGLSSRHPIKPSLSIHITLGKPPKQIFGKSWEFGPTGLTPPPLPVRWDSQKGKKNIMHFRLF